MSRTTLLARLFVSAAFLGSVSPVLADGSSVGQIYRPYVQPLEQELEFVGVYDSRSDDGRIPTSRWARLGYGTALSDTVYGEISVTNVRSTDVRYQSLELEAVWQITEQGEYSSDWGMLFELETGLDYDSHEAVIGVLNSLDIGRFTVLTNASLKTEWGNASQNELETALAIQTRYRWSRALEPTVELFMAEDTLSVGPGLSGTIKLAGPDSLLWNFAVLAGLENSTDYSVKLEIEYEFF